MFWFRNWTLYTFIQQQQQPRVLQQKRIIVRSIRNYPNDKAFIRTNKEISKVWSTTTTLLMMMNRTKCCKSLSIYSTRIHTHYGEKKTKRFLSFVPVHIYEHLLTPNCLIKINSVDHCWQRCSESKCCDFNQYFFSLLVWLMSLNVGCCYLSFYVVDFREILLERTHLHINSQSQRTFQIITHSARILS